MAHMPTTDQPDGAPGVPSTRSLAATAPVRIDGGASADLSTNRTISIAALGIDASLIAPDAVTTSKVLDNAITMAKLEDAAGARVIGALAAGSPSYLTATQLTALVNLATTLLPGTMPALSGDVDDALRGDGTWGSVVSGYVTPEQYGAVGDGVTDDRAAFVLAIAAAIALNGLAAVKLGAGKSYLVSSAVYVEGCRGLQIWGNNSELLFPSDDTSLVLTDNEHAATNRRSGFYFRGTQDCTVRDVRFRGTGNNIASDGLGSGSAVYARRTVGLRIVHCQHEGGGSLYSQDAVADSPAGSGSKTLAVSGTTVTLTDLNASFHGGMVGAPLFIAGCSNVINDGHYRVASVTSSTVLTFVSVGAVNETSTFRWTVSDGDRGTVIDSCVSRNPRWYCTAAANDTTYRNCHWEYNLDHTDTAGIGDSLSISGTTVTLTDAAGRFRPGHHGRPIMITGATTSANNVTALLTYISATQVSFTNASGVTEAFAGSWWIPGGERVGKGAGVGALVYNGTTSVTITANAAVFKTSDVGGTVRMYDATSSANNGVWAITAVASSTQATLTNASGVSESFSGYFTIDTWDNNVNTGSVTRGSTHGIYVFAGRNNVKVLGCTFIANRTCAIKVSGSSSPISDVVVDGCTFQECGEVFIFGADDTNDHDVVRFQNNTIIDCGTSRPNWATGDIVGILGARGVRVCNNDFYYTRDHSSKFDNSGTLAGTRGIHVARYHSTSSQAVEDVLIAGNNFFNNRATATRGQQLAIAIWLESSGQINKWGSTGTLTKSGSTMTLTDSNGYFSRSGDVGKTITLVNAPDAGNNGTFTIASVPNSTSLTFVNAGGVGGSVSAGTYRMVGRNNAGPARIEGNYFSDCCTTAIATTSCVGPEIRNNVFQNTGAWQTVGDVTPRFSGNRILSANTLGASIQIGGTSGARAPAWPILHDNIVTNPRIGGAVGLSFNRDIGIGVGNSTRVDFPLLGKQGKVRPTGGYEECVFAYGDVHVDGDTLQVVVLGVATTLTYKTSAPGALQFNSFSGLLTLLNAIAGVQADDYGASFAAGAVNTQHIRVRRTVQSTSDGNLSVKSQALNPTALVVLCNDVSGNANNKCMSRGSATAGPTPDKTVIWSPLSSWTGTASLTPDNTAARTALAGGPALHIKNSLDAGCCEVMQHDPDVASEEFRFHLGGN